MRRYKLPFAFLLFAFAALNAPAQNVGIGTATPANKLEVKGTAKTDTLAIGTSSPDAQVHIKGSGSNSVLLGQWKPGNTYSGISFNGSLSELNYNVLGGGGTDKSLSLNRPGGMLINFRMANADQMVLSSEGRLGIGLGTNLPTQELEVKGTAKADTVAIGTATPQAQLHTTGRVRFDVLKTASNNLVYANADGELFIPPPVSPINTFGADIPNESCQGVTSSITVTGMPTAVPSANIKVKVNITHPRVGDITIDLISPAGQVLNLAIVWSQTTGQNFTNTVFWDGATTRTWEASAPFTGLFKPSAGATANCPNSSLSSFAALGGGTIVPNGTWKLVVKDVLPGNLSRLDNWSISFDGTEPGIFGRLPINSVPKSNGSGGYSLGSLYDNGNVGIGTAAPQAQLHVQGNGANSVLIGQWTPGATYSGISMNGSISGTDYNFISSTTDKSLYINRPSGSPIVFRMNNADQMSLLPSGRLMVYGDTYSVGQISSEADIVCNGYFKCKFNGSYLTLDKGGADQAIWTSDARLKTNIQIIPSALATLDRLPAVTYHWSEKGYSFLTRNIRNQWSSLSGTKEDNEKLWKEKTEEERKRLSTLQYGFLAQDVEKVFPDWVSEKDGFKQINVQQLLPVVVQAVKELRQEKNEAIDALRKELASEKEKTEALAERLKKIEALLADRANR